MDELSVEQALNVLRVGQLEVEGLMPWSSNYTFLMRVGLDDIELGAIYKPRQGERPLWDFPTGTLCQREYAAFLLSHHLGWDLVPPTVLREGSNGIGSLQLYIPHDPEQHYFTFEGDPTFHEQLQKLVLFDFFVNNADRKSGHVLLQFLDEEQTEGRIWAIDHGICFHPDYKLRTVIWEFASQPIPAPLLKELTDLNDHISTNADGLKTKLSPLLSQDELFAVQKRIGQLLRLQTFPEPGPGRPYPWPPV